MFKKIILLLYISCNVLYSQIDLYKLSHNVEPTFQFIHLNLDPAKAEYSGITNIQLQSNEKISSFRLHGKDFKIEKIELTHQESSIPLTYSFENHGLLKINLNKEIMPNTYNLFISFKGKVSKRSEGIARFEKDSLNYIYTQMATIYARQFFPCFDEPSFKFPYQIEITSPVKNLIVSNTKIIRESISGNSKTILFKKTKPIPSYLIAFAVGPYETVEIPNLSIPGRIILPEGYSSKSWYIKNNTAQILSALEDYFNSSYPYEKLDFVCVSQHMGGMENPGLIVIDELFLIDTKELSNDKKYWRANITAHELAHMWFGNLVTMKWWDDTWLNEGFATWIAEEIVLKEYPELNSIEEVADIIYKPLSVDVKSTAKPVQIKIKGSDDPWLAFSSLSYGKTQVVLRMVENWLGRDVFRKGMKIYFEKYKWKNTTAKDLFNVLEQVSDKKVNDVMNDFILQAGVPLINLEIMDDNKIKLTQKRYKSVENENDYETLWTIPIACEIFDGQNMHSKQILLEKRSQEFELKGISNIEWINLRNNSLGYFIQVLPSSMISKIISTDHLHPTEKKDILLSLDYNYKAGNIFPSEIMELANSLKHTNNDTVIETLVKQLWSIKDVYFKKEKNDKFINYCNQTFMPMLDHIGVDYSNDKIGEKRNFRNYLFPLLKDNPKIISKICDVGKKYLNDTSPLDWDKFIYIFYNVLNNGNDELYEYILSRFKESQNPIERIVMCYILGRFKDNSLIEQNKKFVLEGQISPRERLSLIHSIQYMYSKEAKESNIIPWVAENMDFIKDKTNDLILGYYLPNLIMNYDDYKLFNQLFPKVERSQTMEEKILKKIEQFKRNDKLKELYSKDIELYLAKY